MPDIVHPEDVMRVISEVTAARMAGAGTWRRFVRYREARKDASWAELESEYTARGSMFYALTRDTSADSAAQSVLKDLLLSTSFDLRCAAQSVIAASTLLRRRPRVCEDEEAAFLADAVRTSCDMLNGLASNVLQLRKLERGELAPRAQPFSVRDAVRGVLQMCVMAKCGGADIVWANEADAAATLPERVEGDCVLISLILQNLTINSLKYGDGSRVSVHVTLEEAEAGATHESGGDTCSAAAVLCVEVSDCGPGIADADQARIFAKYARAAPDKSGGAGLGLHISRGFARAMGGDISVRSAVGEGASFTLRVPVRVLPPAHGGGEDADSDAADDTQPAAKKPRHDDDAELGAHAREIAAPDLSAHFTPEELARRPPLKDAFAEVSLEEMLTHVLRNSSEIFTVCKTSSGGGGGGCGGGDNVSAPRFVYVSPSAHRARLVARGAAGRAVQLLSAS
jgi:signal transduction histidine kinase